MYIVIISFAGRLIKRWADIQEVKRTKANRSEVSLFFENCNIYEIHFSMHDPQARKKMFFSWFFY